MLNGRFQTDPLHVQVRDDIAKRISDGEWKPGVLIPSESELAREYGVATGTMRKALHALQSARTITRRQGRGTIVNDKEAVDNARMNGCREKAAEIVRRIDLAPKDEEKLKDRIAQALFEAGADYA